jgi:NAD(P)-dependent dehydrogenase (short-subunit alcohol dehydrogenase family)
MTLTLITGANKGLGHETARQLVGAGHTVYIGARDSGRGQAAARELGARFVRLDVTDQASVDAAADAVAEAEGHLDVLVNNAGIDLMLPVPGGDDQIVHRVFDVNFFATVTGTLTVVPGMVDRGWGAVVNVSSDTARAPEPRQGAYAASKAAVSAFSESVAHEVGPKGVRIHVLYPGWVPTAMGLSGHEDGGSLPPRMVRRTEQQVATLVADRLGGPHVDINAARLPLLAPIARTIAPLSYQKAMRKMATTSQPQR